MIQAINIEHDQLKALLFKLKELGYKWNNGSDIDLDTLPEKNRPIMCIRINMDERLASWSTTKSHSAVDELDFITQCNMSNCDEIIYKINVPDYKFAVLHKLAMMGYTWLDGTEIKPTDWQDKKIESIVAWGNKTITYSQHLIYGDEDAISDDEFISMSDTSSGEYNFVEPDHYKKGDKEVWEIMIDIYGEEKFNNFCLMNAFKYITRAGNKPGDDFKQDISKAVWYLNKLI